MESLPPGADGLEVGRDGERIVIAGARYSLDVDTSRETALLADRDGPWADLVLDAAVDTTRGADSTAGGRRLSMADGDRGLTLTVERQRGDGATSRFIATCTVDELRLHVEIDAPLQPTDCRLLAAPPGDGPRRSRPHFASVFTPEPSAPPRPVVGAAEATALDVLSDPWPARGHWFFTPPPFCYAISREAADPPAMPSGPWASLGLAARPGEYLFTGFGYEGSPDGFCLGLAYEGQSRFEEGFRSPEVVVRFGARDPYEALATDRAGLEQAGLVDTARPDRASWWSRPIFCGWGAQCALAALDETSDEPRYWFRAPRYSRQEHYDTFLERLRAAGIVPGTVVVDDKWQRDYALAEPDPERWPDLAGWIAHRHGEGQRVLLWWPAWLAEGLPAALCVRAADGTAVAADPSEPRYRALLAGQVALMLGPDGLDADGLKIDFTARTPSGSGLQHSGREWGVELLHRLLVTVREAAKAVKPDALLVAHTPNAYLAPLVDAIRLNDMIRLEDGPRGQPVIDEMLHRARIVRGACPGWLIETDDWPAPDRATWRDWQRQKPAIGIPSLYYVDRIDTTREPLEPDDYELIRRTWAAAA